MWREETRIIKTATRKKSKLKNIKKQDQQGKNGRRPRIDQRANNQDNLRLNRKNIQIQAKTRVKKGSSDGKEKK